MPGISRIQENKAFRPWTGVAQVFKQRFNKVGSQEHSVVSTSLPMLIKKEVNVINCRNGRSGICIYMPKELVSSIREQSERNSGKTNAGAMTAILARQQFKTRIATCTPFLEQHCMLRRFKMKRVHAMLSGGQGEQKMGISSSHGLV